MCDRLLVLKLYFDMMQAEGSLNCNLTPSQWIIVGHVRDLLKPLMQAQKVLEGEKYVTLSFVLGIIFGIRKGLSEIASNEDTLESIRSLATKMLADFIKHWGSGDEDIVFAENETTGLYNRLKGLSKLTMMASALDPRTKMLMGIPTEDQEHLWKLIHCEMTKIKTAEEELNHRNENLIPTVLPLAVVDLVDEEKDFYSILMEHGQDNYEAQQQIPTDDILIDAQVDAEIAFYKALQFLQGRKTAEDGSIIYLNPLEWWKNESAKLPILSKLARRVLCIPATSAPSERVFSAAGLTIANRRASLNVENAAALIFLHESWSEVEKIEKFRDQEEKATKSSR